MTLQEGFEWTSLHRSRCEKQIISRIIFEPFCIQFAHCSTCVFVWFGLFGQKPKSRWWKFRQKPRNVARECGWYEWPGFCLAIAVSTRVMAMATSMTSTPPIRCDTNCAGISLRRAMPVTGLSWGGNSWGLVILSWWPNEVEGSVAVGVGVILGVLAISGGRKVACDRLFRKNSTEYCHAIRYPMDGDVLVAIHDHKLG